jgi:hypothetical protein
MQVNVTFFQICIKAIVDYIILALYVKCYFYKFFIRKVGKIPHKLYYIYLIENTNNIYLKKIKIAYVIN